MPAFDVGIIGAGPIGIEMAVCLKEAGVNYIQFDANQIGYTISWWPRNTHFFSSTERLAIGGVPIQNNHQNRITGEDYLAYLRGIVEQFDLKINSFESIEALQPSPNGFILSSQTATGGHHYHCQKVIMAIGDMHFPNLLDIPGENLPHVSHYLRDPHDYFRQRLLIVGGKNSAAESALRCWRTGADVTISYRRAEFDDQRVKHWILPDLLAQIDAGNIRFLPQTTPIEITPTHVLLQSTYPDGALAEGKSIQHETDFVLLHTGFHGDQSLLEMAGVTLHGENRIPQFNPQTMESNVPGVYLAGTVAAGIQQRYTLFIENCHEHAGKITQALTGKYPVRLGSVASRNYHLPFAKIKAN